MARRTNSTRTVLPVPLGGAMICASCHRENPPSRLLPRVRHAFRLREAEREAQRGQRRAALSAMWGRQRPGSVLPALAALISAPPRRSPRRRVRWPRSGLRQSPTRSPVMRRRACAARRAGRPVRAVLQVLWLAIRSAADAWAGRDGRQTPAPRLPADSHDPARPTGACAVVIIQRDGSEGGVYPLQAPAHGCG